MAVVSGGTTLPVDFRQLDVTNLLFGTPTVRTSTALIVDYGGGSRDEFTGFGVQYSVQGLPIAGTLTGYKQFANGSLVGAVEGASASAAEFSNYVLARDTVGAVFYILSGNDQLYGTAFNDYMAGGAGADLLIGGVGADTLIGNSGNDVLDGGSGNDILIGEGDTDTAVYRGLRTDYVVTRNTNGSYTVTDKVTGRDGSDTLTGVEILQFSNGTLSVEVAAGLPFTSLFQANVSQGKAIAAGYQVLLGGVPSVTGFDFLIVENLTTNFGAGSGPVFNDENIYINVVNSLVQGNATAAANFNSLAAGATLSQKVASLYSKVIPIAKQSAEGLAFLTRPEGLKFYQDIAQQRGITAESGPAIVALASLLKVAVDGKIGIGNPVNDLIMAIADGSATLPVSTGSFLPIETIDGTKFDADDGPDVMPGFSGPPPIQLVGLSPVEAEVSAI